MDELTTPFIEALKSGGPFGVGLGVGLTLYFLERRDRMSYQERLEILTKQVTGAMNDTAATLRELNSLLLSPRRRG